jgi:hypothetical protein
MARKLRRRAPLLVLLTLGLSLMMVSQASAAGRFYGSSLGTWSGRWWQWAYSVPADANHPLFDATGADCMNGQASKGFVFLAGIFNESGDVVRDDCTVPVGRGLFFPVLNVECSSLEAAPFYGDDPASLAACLDPWSSSGSFATIDGAPVPTFSVRSQVYGIGPVADPNILGAAPGATGVSMTDGLYGVLPPLPPGHHTLHFGGAYVLDGTPIGYDLDITYHLTVA